jgi:hypothetical protein
MRGYTCWPYCCPPLPLPACLPACLMLHSAHPPTRPPAYPPTHPFTHQRHPPEVGHADCEAQLLHIRQVPHPHHLAPQVLRAGSSRAGRHERHQSWQGSGQVGRRDRQVGAGCVDTTDGDPVCRTPQQFPPATPAARLHPPLAPPSAPCQFLSSTARSACRQGCKQLQEGSERAAGQL